MQIDHGGGQSRMAHQHLDFSNIVSGFQQMGGEAVAQGVNAFSVFNPGFFSSLFVNSSILFLR
jgi:hypothetical protein